MRSRTPLSNGSLLGVIALLASMPAAAGRLGTDVVPTFQSIHLRVDADSSTYRGSVRVVLDVKKPTRTVELHAEGQDLRRVALHQNGKAIPVTQKRGERGVLTLSAAQPLAQGAATLEIAFTNPFNTQAVALYRMEKDGLGYTFTQFESEHARGAFPCWDEPAFKFPYQLTLEIPARHQALFNTPVERESTKDGWKTIVFKRTPPLSSYLLAIATGPLEFTPIPGVKIPARVVTVKGQSHLTGPAVQTTPAMLAALEEYFGRPYPFEKLDLIAVPEYWYGAMENPGAITYSDNILLADPRDQSPEHRRNLFRVTSHELAHMWFGDLVTMEWWDDLWLNESFADWLGDKIADRTAPEYKHLLAELQKIQDIMETDARTSTEPIRLHAETGEDAMRSVGVAYNKGKAVLSMFEQWMGAETFRQGVVDYLQAHAWKNAEAADLWSALGKASGKDVSAIMGQFIEQPGLALVTAEPLAGGSVRLSQKRFLNHGTHAVPLTWQIPMTLSYPDGGRVRRVSILLGAEPQTVKLEAEAPAWILPNAGASGYYRWSVPKDMLLALAREAPAALQPAERIELLGNLNALLDAGEIHGDLYLQLLSDMARDPEPAVAASVLAGLGKARRAFVPDDMQDVFAVYVRRALKPMVERFGLEKKPGEDQTVSLLRPELITWLGRNGRDEATLTFANALATRHLDDPNSVDPAIAGAALQIYAIHGDRALFDRYRAAFESAQVPVVRLRYLNSLGCFSDPALEEEALRYALEGPLRPNELFAVSRSISERSDQAADRSFQWLREHYDQVASRVPPAFRTFLARAGSGCSPRRLAVAREFFSDPARTVQGMDKALAKVSEQVQDCVGLREREGAVVATYLRGLLGAK